MKSTYHLNFSKNLDGKASFEVKGYKLIFNLWRNLSNQSLCDGIF